MPPINQRRRWSVAIDSMLYGLQQQDTEEPFESVWKYWVSFSVEKNFIETVRGRNNFMGHLGAAAREVVNNCSDHDIERGRTYIKRMDTETIIKYCVPY